MKLINTKYFYGWNIAGVCLLANFISVGCGFYIFNTFMEPLCLDRGWTRTDINVTLMLGIFFAVLGRLVYGTLINKIGTRVLMTTGPFISGISFYLLFNTNSLWQFYIFSSLLFLGNGAYGGIVANTAVNNWFIDKRGKALGFSSIGISLSGAIFPLSAMILLINTNFHITSIVFSLIIMSLGPISWLVIRDWPEDYGFIPDGHTDGENNNENQIEKINASKVSNDKIWLTREFFKNSAFWKIGLTYGLVMTGIVGIMTQLKPRFVDIGFDDFSAMIFLSLTALIGASGKYFWGKLCDNYEPGKIVAVLIIMNCMGIIFALFQNSVLSLILFIIIFGFSMGGVMSTYPIIVAHFFGRRSFSKVIKYTSLFLLIELIGLHIAGKSYDISGSYDYAYIFFILVDIVALGLVLSLDKSDIDNNN